MAALRTLAALPFDASTLKRLDPSALRPFDASTLKRWEPASPPAALEDQADQEERGAAESENTEATEADDKRTGPGNRRRPPRRGGRRAPDPEDRRSPERWSAADVGAWAFETDRGRAHRVSAVANGGGCATFDCGQSGDLRVLRHAPDGRKRCVKCERART